MLVVMLNCGCQEIGSRCWQALATCKLLQALPMAARFQPRCPALSTVPCRSVGATAMNEQSSRSHMVFILAIKGSNEGTGQKVKGALLRLGRGLGQDSVPALAGLFGRIAALPAAGVDARQCACGCGLDWLHGCAAGCRCCWG